MPWIQSHSIIIYSIWGHPNSIFILTNAIAMLPISSQSNGDQARTQSRVVHQPRAIQFAKRWLMELIKWPSVLTTKNAMGNFVICGAPWLNAAIPVIVHNHLFCFRAPQPDYHSDQCNPNAAKLISIHLRADSNLAALFVNWEQFSWLRGGQWNLFNDPVFWSRKMPWETFLYAVPPC